MASTHTPAAAETTGMPKSAATVARPAQFPPPPPPRRRRTFRMSSAVKSGGGSGTSMNRPTSLTDAERVLLRSTASANVAAPAVAAAAEEQDSNPTNDNNDDDSSSKKKNHNNSNNKTALQHASCRIADDDDDSADSNPKSTTQDAPGTGPNNGDPATAALLPAARRRLSRSLMAAPGLPPRERDFLERLVERADTADCLARATAVLESDLLYGPQKQTPETCSSSSLEPSIVSAAEQQDEPPKPQIHHQRRISEQPPFHRELWTEYASQLSITVQQHEEETIRTSETSHQTKKKKDLVQFFKEAVFGGTNARRNQDRDGNNSNKPDDDDDTEVTTTTTTTTEEIIPFHILGTSVDDPDASPHVLSPPLMDALRPFLPLAVQQDNYWLKYSLKRDGASIANLIHCARGSARTLLAIETVEGDVLGSFTSSPWRAHAAFYGSGEAFVWRLRRSRCSWAARACRTAADRIALEGDVQVYPWSGKNRNVQCVRHERELAVGGGPPDEDGGDGAASDGKNDFGCFAFALTNDLSRGTSGPSSTFDNPTSLTPKDVFTVLNVEVWTLSPVEDLEQAEKIELGRQFVFDHGNFIGQ